jgi:hypothetical protein
MDLLTFLATMRTQGYFTDIAQNRLAQFGTPARRYLGAEILPERNVPDNAYRETQIRYRTGVIANDGTRYSPVQKKTSGELFGEFLVELGNSDIGSEITARDYDALLQYVGVNSGMDAIAQVVNFVDTHVNRALIEKNELQRWQAIVSAQVVRQGDNAYSETVQYLNPTGHRAAAGGTWSSDAYDPYDDIVAMTDFLQDKGYTVNRIVSSRKVLSILARNTKVITRTGRVWTFTSSTFSDQLRRTQREDVNTMLSADGLPPIEMYDLQYRTQTGIGRFMPDTVMCFFCSTGRDETVDWGDATMVVPDTLGYTAIGRPTGQQAPGRVIRVNAFDNKPPRVECEGWQTSLPVITEPEALAVITGIG